MLFERDGVENLVDVFRIDVSVQHSIFNKMPDHEHAFVRTMYTGNVGILAD